MRSILTFLLFIICFPALACRPAPFDFEKEVAEADVVAIAYVTGIFAAEAEAGLLNDNEENDEEWQGDLTQTQIFTASNQVKKEETK